MALYPGNDAVTFVSKSDTGAEDRLGVKAPEEVSTVQPGCSLQPMGVRDQIGNTQFSSASHKCISPPTEVVAACKAEDRLEFGGVDFRVVGVKKYRDFRGRLDHVDIYAEEQHG